MCVSVGAYVNAFEKARFMLCRCSTVTLCRSIVLSKNDSSERTVPLVGVALHAARKAVESHPGAHEALFPNYAKPRGNDSASAAVNKRLKRWGLTSHSFRHAMTDRLKNADVSPTT